MGLDTLLQAGNAITSFFAGLNGVGAVLVVIGLGILLAIGAGIGLYMLVQLVKQIPRMTPWEFLKFVVISAVVLIVIGIILP
ncbi:hypothetical protein Smar_1275 [Staphylothermus marinus F1]|uniref:Uncharacterized protein n=1 Tax=Staphylothermus marinus (strain ATCC 43588 / DSM 3639 / JCM 9404 / F1) TaxID=399550 RepID=A3DP06_STAMF|nr:hypothetical protein [Staphylothermus marinus]ABN70366.1 hypothetical protein Smar_1275 [Staphylothermus marinus F1]